MTQQLVFALAICSAVLKISSAEAAQFRPLLAESHIQIINKAAVRFAPDLNECDQLRCVQKVERVQKYVWWPLGQTPAVGDEVVAINGRPIIEWSNQHLAICKSTNRLLCEQTLYSNLMSEVLHGWNRGQMLTYTLKRGDHRWTIKVPVRSKNIAASPNP